jgi:glycosyltransferase involved in cell wall biosynthesis
MKIMHIVGGLDVRGGGPANAIIGLNKALNQNEVDSIIWTTNAGYIENLDVPLKKTITYKGAKVIFYPYPNSIVFRAIKKLFYSGMFAVHFFWGILRNMKHYDIIHIHGSFSFFEIFASKLANFYKKPYILSPHGSLIKDLIYLKSRYYKSVYMKLVGKKNIENAAAIHCLTGYEANEINRFDFKAKKLIVLPIGIDEEEFVNSPPPMELFKKYPQLNSKFVILFLGRINFKKGLDDLISAMNVIIKKVPHAHLLIVGNDEENYMRDVNKWIRQYQLEDVVTYAGPVFGQERIMFFQDSHIFVLPSYSENFGLAVIEAMYFGLPVVITDNVGASEHVLAADAGVVIRKNFLDLAEAIMNLVQDRKLAEKFGNNGKKYVNEHLTWDKVAQRFLQAYKGIST